MKVLAHIKAFLKDEEGASGIEYALIGAMVAVIIAGFSERVQNGITATFEEIVGALTP